MLEVSPLGDADIDELGALSLEPAVVRFSDHLPTEQLGREWLGTADPHRGLTLGAREGSILRAVAQLTFPTHRRQIHIGRIRFLASDGAEADRALDALLGTIVPTAERWFSVQRLELRCPATHPRVDALFAQQGFVREIHHRGSLLTDGMLIDEVRMAWLREGQTVTAQSIAAPEPPPRGTPLAVHIRPQRASDAAVMTRLMSEDSVIHGTLQMPFQRTEHWEGRFSSNDPQRIFLLMAELDGQVVGAGSLVINPVFRRRHEGTLGLSIAHAFQGRGVGRCLVDALVALADELSLQRVELGVFVDNDRGRRLYERAGFVTEGRRVASAIQNGVLVDDLIMARQLPRAR